VYSLVRAAERGMGSEGVTGLLNFCLLSLLAVNFVSCSNHSFVILYFLFVALLWVTNQYCKMPV
jgi:hypothetical protein